MQEMEGQEIAIGIGANLGEPLAQVRLAIVCLKQIPHLHISKTSSFYQSQALVPKGCIESVPNYMNAVVVGKTSLGPEELLEKLLGIEKQMGRCRQKKWESRVIDLDLLLYGMEIYERNGLQIPHPEMLTRRFVLEPLAEIKPDWIHPGAGKTMKELAGQISGSGDLCLIERSENGNFY